MKPCFIFYLLNYVLHGLWLDAVGNRLGVEKRMSMISKSCHFMMPSHFCVTTSSHERFFECVILGQPCSHRVWAWRMSWYLPDWYGTWNKNGLFFFISCNRRVLSISFVATSSFFVVYILPVFIQLMLHVCSHFFPQETQTTMHRVFVDFAYRWQCQGCLQHQPKTTPVSLSLVGFTDVNVVSGNQLIFSITCPLHLFSCCRMGSSRWVSRGLLSLNLGVERRLPFQRIRGPSEVWSCRSSKL
jgi:hypothetical protein